MNVQQQEQFYQMMTRLRIQENSRAASIPDARVTEMINGLLVSKAKKEPVVIDLQEYARSRKGVSSVSVPGINKLREIHDFIKSNGRY